ncbi:MAG: hypothetical protein IKB50_01665 [Clostridia bacterium]|nr:hypothetical protein [Clostridia bacterium]
MANPPLKNVNGDILYKYREHLEKVARREESARKKRVEQYEKEIRDREQTMTYFYKNELERGRINQEEYANLLKEQSDRYRQYSKDVLNVAYMTQQEKLLLSQEYMKKSEQILFQHLELMKEVAREKVNISMDGSVEYMSDRNYYSNWNDFGDTPEDAFARVDQRLSEAVLAGVISYEEYMERLKGYGTAMYEDRIANSNRWLEHEREMNRISAEDYISGLYRMRKYTGEYYSKGMISHRQYVDGLQELDERIFNERVAQHREILRNAEKEKRAIDENANAEIDALRTKYEASLSAMDSSGREEELSYLMAQEKIYESAQTREGKERLAEIRESIERINDEKKRLALKEDFESSKGKILADAEEDKSAIDRNAMMSAVSLGLYYDEETGYRMIRHVNRTFEKVLNEQTTFSDRSGEEMGRYNEMLTGLMTDATKGLSEGILTNFRLFADGVEAIKKKIFEDVASVNSLDFSRFGSSTRGGNTNITYNDYGDKKITGSAATSSFFDTLSNLIAKGGKL